jgi:hypothetical protein
MLDNMTVNNRGEVLMQEDVGNQAYLGGVWLYDIGSGGLTKIAQHDPNRFTPGAGGFLTKDEESSGIVPARFLGEGWYVLDVQAHYASAVNSSKAVSCLPCTFRLAISSDRLTRRQQRTSCVVAGSPSPGQGGRRRYAARWGVAWLVRPPLRRTRRCA